MGRRRTNSSGAGSSRPPQEYADRNKQRRTQYAQDGESRERKKQDSRERYQRANPINQRLAGGLRTEGVEREVYADTLEEPATVFSYTIPEAAVALGRSEAQLRRWLEADKFPVPYLRDTARGHAVYSHGELEVIARCLAQHEQDFSNLTREHQHVIENLFQHVHAYRVRSI